MSDPAAIERAVLAEVALSDGWLSAKQIQERLRLPHTDLANALRNLVRVGDLDWNGVVLSAEIDLHGFDAVRYHLPRWPVRVGRRMERVS